jgi:enamine deaminase RidA (YjgF/YER057c/UK114 family)
MADVVKTTTFVVNYQQDVHRPIIGEMRAQYLPADALPTSTLLGVQALARPEFMVEIEAVAII